MAKMVHERADFRPAKADFQSKRANLVFEMGREVGKWRKLKYRFISS